MKPENFDTKLFINEIEEKRVVWDMKSVFFLTGIKNKEFGKKLWIFLIIYVVFVDSMQATAQPLHQAPH